jgi:hypothetical protein
LSRADQLEPAGTKCYNNYRDPRNAEKGGLHETTRTWF